MNQKNRLTLKSIKIAKSLSRETLAFSCTIYFDGVKIGTTENNGCGGSNDTYIQPNLFAALSKVNKLNLLDTEKGDIILNIAKEKDKALLRNLNEWINTEYPQLKWAGSEKLDYIISSKIGEYESYKRAKRLEKNNLVFLKRLIHSQVTDQFELLTLKLNKPISELTETDKKYVRTNFIEPQLKKDKIEEITFINTNF